jgi:hypothetical protein
MWLIPRPWLDAGNLSDWTLQLTAARAKELVETLHDLIETWPEDEDDPEAAPFKLNLNAFLRPGSTPAPETEDAP